MQEAIKQLELLQNRLEDAIEKLAITDDELEIERLTAESQAEGFWNEPEAAAKTSQRLAALTKHVGGWRALEAEVRDALELAGLSEASQDAALDHELTSTIERVTTELDAREFELKLSGPHDRASAILEIHAGTGGTDAQDWAEMLERMYLRYAEKAGFTTEIDSVSHGEEAGIKSVTIEINGPYAFGKLKGEGGVHRLVRLSPFNSDNLRQTSFALVEVLPQIENQTELEIDPKDLRIDVYRSGGHGGQSVNTTDSAVRITHLPTNTVVAIQNERSQLQNREKAMGILKSRLTALMEEQQKAALSDLRASDRSAEWGSQIRSYVLHPYTKVKDHRTGVETSQAYDVLDGALEPFIEGYLSSNITSSRGDAS